MEPTNSERSTGFPAAYVLQPGQGVPGFGSEVKAARGSTGGQLTLIESRTTGGAPPHVHTREDECLYVVDGVIVGQIGAEEFSAGPGGFVFMPRGVAHTWDVADGGTATVLMITVPGMLEEFLAEVHAAHEGRAAIAARYGITFLPSTQP
jgi:quercetin dioxygenase-like cupin family protein